jgi:hypothetical protein
VRCLLIPPPPPDDAAAPGSSAAAAADVRSMTARSASCMDATVCCGDMSGWSCCSSSPLWVAGHPASLSSPVTNSTFLTRPPRVVISALSARRRSALSARMRSGRRSARSSQQSEARTKRRPSSSLDTSTVSSSDSVGSRHASSVISDVCRFSSLTCWITSASSDALSVYTITSI